MADGPEINPQEPESPTPNATQEDEKATPVLRAELQVPQAAINEYHSGQANRECRERWKLGLEAATLLVIVCYTIIAGYQGCQMRIATVATKKSADAATRAAAAAVRSNEITVQANRDDQRAWVGPIGTIKPSKEALSRGGDGFVFGARLTNSGKSPAMKVKTLTNWRYLAKEAKFEPTYPIATDSRPGIGFLFPGALATASTRPFDIPRQNSDVLITGNMILYIFGKIDYLDSFNKPHATTWCYWLMPDLASMTQCDTYNAVN